MTKSRLVRLFSLLESVPLPQDLHTRSDYILSSDSSKDSALEQDEQRLKWFSQFFCRGRGSNLTNEAVAEHDNDDECNLLITSDEIKFILHHSRGK